MHLRRVVIPDTAESEGQAVSAQDDEATEAATG